MLFARPTTRAQRRTGAGVWIGLLMIGLQISTQPAFATQSIIPVTTAAELEQALQAAQPGQTIQLADGIYADEFTVTVSGTVTQPITLQGSPHAILDRGAIQGGYGFHLDGANYWILSGFTIRNAAKGVMLDQASYNILDRLHIHSVGQEAIHFRTCSSFNTLQYSMISDTGLTIAGYGEGVYIGSDASNWPQSSCDGDGRDKSDFNQIRNNTFGPDVRAEAIDVKEGTVSGKIIGNHFDATGLSGENYADSWVDIKGNAYEVGLNEGWHGANSSLQHGFETHAKLAGWGRHNLFYANIAHVDGNGYGYHIDNDDPEHGNKICADNQAFNAADGVANIPMSGTPPASNVHSQAAPVSLPLQNATETIWLPLVFKPPC